MTVGPTVTRYEIELGPGVKVARVTRYNATSPTRWPLRTSASSRRSPASRRSVSRCPTDTASSCPRRPALAPEAAAATGPLDVAIGKDIAGDAVFLDLATTPHVLIAGATGAGKSSCMNSILASLLMRRTPDQVRLILVDPKQVEMGQYNRLPHLFTQPVTNPKKAANALGWAVKEMERRYELLSAAATATRGYNAAFDQGRSSPTRRARRAGATPVHRCRRR